MGDISIYKMLELANKERREKMDNAQERHGDDPVEANR
jgi:hypothetical protein